MKCTNCIHNEVCKYKTDFNGVKETKEEIVTNYDGWAMYKVEVTCQAYTEDTDALWMEEMARQVNQDIEEVF